MNEKVPCTACNDEILIYFGHKVLCAECNYHYQPDFIHRLMLYQNEIDLLNIYDDLTNNN